MYCTALYSIVHHRRESKAWLNKKVYTKWKAWSVSLRFLDEGNDSQETDGTYFSRLKRGRVFLLIFVKDLPTFNIKRSINLGGLYGTDTLKKSLKYL